MKVVKIVGIFLIALFLRIWITPQLDFAGDQQAIYELGKHFYETRVFPQKDPGLFIQEKASLEDSSL